MAFVTGLPRLPGLRAARGASKRPRLAARRAAVAMLGGMSTPSSLPSSWYERVTAALDVELGSHSLRVDGGPAGAAHDAVFVDETAGLFCVVDAGASSLGDAAALLAAVRAGVRSNAALYVAQATCGLAALLSRAVARAHASAATAALLASVDGGVLRVAWIGPVGLLVVRDDKVQFRTYPRVPPRDALEAALAGAVDVDAMEVDGGQRRGDRAARVGRADRAASEVHSDFFELEDGDLVIAGSDGVFGNLSEAQILAFVRPVPDPVDTTLALANNTCLGSWRTDDVHFISYYLAHLAENFATAENSAPFLPFPFPPSPHVDDVTVVVGSCSYKMT